MFQIRKKIRKEKKKPTDEGGDVRNIMQASCVITRFYRSNNILCIHYIRTRLKRYGFYKQKVYHKTYGCNMSIMQHFETNTSQ